MKLSKLTIRRKVASVVVLVTALAILLSSVGVFVLQRSTFTKVAESELNTIADVVGGSLNAAFLVTPNSPADAERTLERLRNNSEIDQAHVFQFDSVDLFASTPTNAVPSAELLGQLEAFARKRTAVNESGEAVPEVLREYRSSPTGLWLIRELVDERGTPFALVALHSTFKSLRADERRSVMLLGGVTLVMLAVAFWAAMQLNRNLTAPILALAGAVRKIEESGDHTIRAPKLTGDEIGQLAEGINHMIDAIEERSAALRESEERSRTLLAAAPAAIVVLDAETRKFTEVNENACQLFGLSRAELLQRGPIELSRPLQTNGRDATRYGAELIEQAAAGQPARFDWIHLSADGREIPCEVFLVRLPTAQRRLLCGTIVDMTERKRAEEVLLRSQTGLEEAQAMAHLGNWEIDLTTGVAEWSREQCRLMGWPADQPAPRWDQYVQLVHENDRPQVAQYGERLLAGDASGTVEFHGHRGKAAARILSVKAAVVRNAEGKVIRLAGTTMDVTEQRRLELERRNLEGQLRQAQKLDALGTLAGGIAHDFNNVLSAILGNVELGRADLGDRESVRECLDEINKAGRRAKDLVQRILAFSRRQEQSLRRIALQPVIEEALQLLRSTLPAKVDLRFRADSNLPPVMGDPSQVHQVIMNLATNAWHALDERPGNITFDLVPVQVDSRLSKSNPDLHPGPYLRLAVTDTGKGMNAATLERIFEPFFTTKPQGKGTGLGLSMVHGIMKSHAGAITVESQTGKGACFHLYFPAVEAAEVVVDTVTANADVAGGGQHILFVDDEEPLVYLATRMLERLGYRVTGFTDPAEALAAFRADPRSFDLVVTDFSMPGASGLELAREMLKIRADATIILASGYLRDEEVKVALDSGIREVVLKPNTVDQLGAIIHKLISRQPSAKP